MMYNVWDTLQMLYQLSYRGSSAGQAESQGQRHISVFDVYIQQVKSFACVASKGDNVHVHVTMCFLSVWCYCSGSRTHMHTVERVHNTVHVHCTLYMYIAQDTMHMHSVQHAMYFVLLCIHVCTRTYTHVHVGFCHV